MTKGCVRNNDPDYRQKCETQFFKTCSNARTIDNPAFQKEENFIVIIFLHHNVVVACSFHPSHSGNTFSGRFPHANENLIHKFCHRF
jgi:hypothetical protein